MSLFTSNTLLQNYYDDLDKLDFKYRKLILENVLRYLVYTYNKQGGLDSLPLKYACELIQDRITYFHHYSKNI